MSEGAVASGNPPPRRSARTSIRHSLGLSSVSKAFADVMSKDSRESSKVSKKEKDISSRRLSAANVKPAAPRASMGDMKPSTTGTTPESKTFSSRRMSTTLSRNSTDEQLPKDMEPPPSRPVALRPRNLNGPSSLPKYRPKSTVLIGVKVAPSPVRAGTRRRLSSSDDETDEKEEFRRGVAAPSAEKISRPISPLPARATRKTDFSSVQPNSQTGSPSKGKAALSSTKASPLRPTKTVKTSTATSAARSAQRPSSAASSNSSAIPKTPQSSSTKNVALRRSTHDKGKPQSAPTNDSPNNVSRDSPSPLTRRTRNISKFSPLSNSTNVGNMSHISEANSEDSEAEDVELLLAPVAALGAPTPAMPRMPARKREIPVTPTRASSQIPTRANLSYISPVPSSSTHLSSVRPPVQPLSGNGRAGRGSILSWEQLASEASRTLGEEEIESMLSEMPAPFLSGPVSPALSLKMDIPESPCLSALDSPGGYGSISQVLLPDITPSPAVHHRHSLSPSGASGDASTVTLLRLQLAAMENTARERLYQIQSMEEELHYIKEINSQQVSETRKGAVLSSTSHSSMEEDHRAYVASLEDQLFHAQDHRDHAVQEAILPYQEAIESKGTELKLQGLKYELLCSANVAGCGWRLVHESAELELNAVIADQAVLSILLSQLDGMCAV